MAIEESTIIGWAIGGCITFVVGMASWLIKNTWGRIQSLEEKNEKRKDEIAHLELKITQDFASKEDIQRLEDNSNRRFDDLEKLLLEAIKDKNSS